MPRRPPLAVGDLAHHVLNLRVGRLSLFVDKRGRDFFSRLSVHSFSIFSLEGGLDGPPLRDWAGVIS